MRRSFGIIGVGAFGTLAARHLAPWFDLVLHDAAHDPSDLARELGARAGTLAAVGACDIVLLAVPVQKLREVLADIAPLLRPGVLVLDVCSVKLGPTSWMRELLPSQVDIVGTHPLFGPQSGRDDINGLNIALCPVRGARTDAVARFCADRLGLRVTVTTPEAHDREAAWVQGLTHMIARIVADLDLSPMRFPTRTYELLQSMTEMVRYDSDELFRTIARDNPFAAEAKAAFFAAARRLEDRLGTG